MGNRLAGKVAIVTGAGRGIGRAEALALASEGAKVVVNDLGCANDGTGESTEPADEVVAEIIKNGGDAVVNYDTVATTEGGENIVKTALDSFGRLDILVNNAGILRNKMVFNTTAEGWDAVIKVHLYGHFNTIKPACVLFRQQRSGHIVNTSSSAGLGDDFGYTSYGSAKEGIIGLTRAVAKDMGRYGVTCNAIRPEATTRLTRSDEAIEIWRKYRGGVDITERWGEIRTPETIAALVVWLVSDANTDVTGRTFDVGPGRIAIYTEPVIENTVRKDGEFTIDEVFEIMPTTVAAGVINRTSQEPSKE